MVEPIPLLLLDRVFIHIGISKDVGGVTMKAINYDTGHPDAIEKRLTVMS